MARSLINRIHKPQGSFLGHCEERRETGTFSDNWNDRRKMQQGRTARKDIGWTNKVDKCRISNRYTKSDRG